MGKAEDDWSDVVSKPFQPAPTSGAGSDVDAMLRIAAAVEYMAGQIGEMNRKLDQLTEASRKAPLPDQP